MKKLLSFLVVFTMMSCLMAPAMATNYSAIEQTKSSVSDNTDLFRISSIFSSGVFSIYNKHIEQFMQMPTVENEVDLEIDINYELIPDTNKRVPIGVGESKIIYPEESINFGDINGDGIITQEDIDLLSKYIVDNTVKIFMENADVNLDKKIDSSDLGILTRFFNGQLDKLPYLDGIKPVEPIKYETESIKIGDTITSDLDIKLIDDTIKSNSIPSVKKDEINVKPVSPVKNGEVKNTLENKSLQSTVKKDEINTKSVNLIKDKKLNIETENTSHLAPNINLIEDVNFKAKKIAPIYELPVQPPKLEIK